jgi:polar amino acid transport system substrate-binding protein
VLLAESGVARLQRDGVLRAGILYNEPPFGELNIRGELVGFDADLARALAEAWGIEVEFVQVTRQNALATLRDGLVDALFAAQVHRRELDATVEFSMTYHLGKQAVMVRADSSIETLANLSGQRVGYVVGTAGETALLEYIAVSGSLIQPQPYLTLDQAYSALFAGDVAGVAARQEHLLRVAAAQLDAIKLLDEAIAREPFAVVVPRQDVHLRNLINRTLQWLVQEEKLQELQEQYFPGMAFAEDALPRWRNIGEEAPSPLLFGTDVPFPPQYIVPRLNSERRLRVAGMTDLPPDAPVYLQRVDAVNRAVVERLAARWNVQVVYVGGDPLQLVESGQADLAVGVVPDWEAAGRVDFTLPYMLHGDRLMYKERDDINSFVDLRGRIIGVLQSDAGAQERAQAWADSVTARVRFYITDDERAAITLLVETNADVIYGDSLKLLTHLEQNAELKVTPRWYSRNYPGFAVPRNDLDFRLLVEYTLQDLIRTGELATLLQPVLPPGSDAPGFDVWPGSRAIGGFLGG